MHGDPVRKVQELVYQQLLSIRAGLANTVTAALKEAEGGSAPAGSGDDAKVSSEEADKLRAENKKLEYRIGQLLRAIDEIESKQAASAAQ